MDVRNGERSSRFEGDATRSGVRDAKAAADLGMRLRLVAHPGFEPTAPAQLDAQARGGLDGESHADAAAGARACEAGLEALLGFGVLGRRVGERFEGGGAADAREGFAKLAGFAFGLGGAHAGAQGGFGLGRSFEFRQRRHGVATDLLGRILQLADEPGPGLGLAFTSGRFGNHDGHGAEKSDAIQSFAGRGGVVGGKLRREVAPGLGAELFVERLGGLAFVVGHEFGLVCCTPARRRMICAAEGLPETKPGGHPWNRRNVPGLSCRPESVQCRSMLTLRSVSFRPWQRLPRWLALGVALAAAGHGLSAADLPAVPWGRIVADTNGGGGLRIEVDQWPADGKLSLPTPFPNITSARWLKTPTSNKPLAERLEPVGWVFNADASKLELLLPKSTPAAGARVIVVETAEKTAQFAGGRITFSALDGQVQGAKAKLESHPGNHRVGFWTAADDRVSWDFKPTRWGRYDLELTYSADGGDGTTVWVEIANKKSGNQKFTFTRPSTGSWYRYRTLSVAQSIYLENSEPFTLSVGCSELKGVAVMNLKSVTLRPTFEGPMPVQDAAGLITLPSSNGVTHSVMMRYEPAAVKNCMGYWVNAADWAEWEFAVSKPGTFEVEVWQGCGKGQGGSDVAVEVGGQRFTFVVEDTGHFQNFVPRRLGKVRIDKPGVHSLAVKPQRKQAGAIMDIRQVRLVPEGQERE